MGSTPSRSARRDSAAPRLLLIGANHRTCPLDVREGLLRRVTYQRIAAPGTLRPFDDLVLLATCNRVEVYAVSRAADDARDAILHVFGSASFYELSGAEAAAHLFRVASGLDSVALGETQIADQVRRTTQERPKSWRRPGPLADLFARAARLAPRLRRLVGVDGKPASASHAAVRYVREVVRIPNPRVTLVGSGKMARLAAEALRGDARITVMNRDRGRAETTARRLNGRAASLADLRKVLEETDVLIAATSSKKRLLGRGAVARACAARTGHPIWIIDLGVPRNIDPAAGGLEGVTLLTVDDLVPWAGTPPDPAARARAEGKIRNEADRFLARLRPRTLDHVLALRMAAEQLRQSEVRRALALMPHATDTERAVLEKLADRLVNRLLHAPTELVRRLQAQGDDAAIAGLLETRPPLGGRT